MKKILMNDPVRGCDVYKDIGCAHVDGFLCDYPNCSILKDYKMNSRIRELAEQAYFDVDISTNIKVPREFVERFAELIVKECADMVASSSLPDAYSEPCLQEIADEMKEHFGIK